LRRGAGFFCLLPFSDDLEIRGLAPYPEKKDNQRKASDIMKVIITGASKGIGWGIARVLGREGFQLGLLARSGDLLEETANAIRKEGGQAVTATADIRDPASAAGAIADLIDGLGGIDALINNAGTVLRKNVLEIPIETWQAMIETNVNGLFYCTRAVLDSMCAQRHGHIINISSIAGRVPLPGGSGYAASKFAVTGFSRSIFQELRDYGIKVTTVYPGSVDSASERHDAAADASWKVMPEEVGAACAQLLRTRQGNCISELEIRPLARPPKD
jgi:3-oxoacyl-[acyl-carrier protein] reductase